MKAKEFISGNYIEVPFGKEWWVREIWDVLGSSGIIVTENGRYCFDGSDGTQEEFRPIPLTEEWLLKFGFENKLNEYTNLWVKKNNWFHFEYDQDEKKWFCIMTSGGRTITDIEYVHKLQNLYFSLTGEELTLIK